MLRHCWPPGPHRALFCGVLSCEGRPLFSLGTSGPHLGVSLTDPFIPKMECFNFICFLQPYNTSHLYVCCTYAFQPKCTYILSAAPPWLPATLASSMGSCPHAHPPDWLPLPLVHAHLHFGA